MIFPIKDFKWNENISQLFGVNRAVYEAKIGTPGHNGLDFIVRDAKRGYGTPIISATSGKVTKVFDSMTDTRGAGIYIQQTNGNEIIETVYWHLSEIIVKVGERVTEGQVIGLMGNNGFVMPKPTPDRPYDGTHLHFAVRRYINHFSKNNDYRGFIDPTPLLFSVGEKLPIRLDYNLFVGRGGDSVSWLQTILKIEFPDITFEPIGYFGNQTRLAVIRLQTKYGITPSWGYVGPKTRDFLNKKYSHFST